MNLIGGVAKGPITGSAGAEHGDEIVALINALNHRQSAPRIPARAWTGTGISLGAVLCPSAPEDFGDSQPLVDSLTGCALVWDGRLDNRDELLAQLHEERLDALRLGPHAPDSHFILAAYLRWDEDCAARLLGDFAFAVWDPRRRSVFATRDHMGIRPLFYSSHGGQFRFASEFQALVQIPALPRDFDEIHLSEFLVWWSGFPDVERTLYQAIRRLPPAHWLRWSWDGLEIRRYWEIDPGRRLRYARHSDYVDRLGEELSQAVARRTRVCAPAGVLLSGGIDSSSIAVLAARHWNATQPLRAFHARVADENDESRLAREVAAQSGIPFNLCALPVEDVLADLESHVRFVGLPFADLRWKNEVQMDRWLQSQGVQVVLTGDGSDELFNFPCAYVADLIRHGRLLQFIREIGPYSRYHCHTVTEMLRLSLPYLIPLPALRLWKRWKWRTPPAWINPDFARRTDLLTRLRWIRPRLRFDSLSANEDHYGMTRGRRVIAFELRHFLATSCGLELRYPFFDRRLHEFLFAVPWEVKTTNGRFKSLLREVPNLLSSPLRTLTQKANYDPYLDRVSEAQNWNVLRHLFHDPPPRAAEFVSMPAARAVFKAFEERGSRQRQAEVLCLAGFFLWLKSQPSVNLEMARPEGVEFETQAGGKASTAKG